MIKVTLRFKEITGDRHSLYLDFYPPIPHPDTGEDTRREFLKLYVYDKPKTPFDKEHNKETKALAQAIRAKRQIEIQNKQYGFLSQSSRDIDFVEYFRELADKRKESNHGNWISALYYLEQFTDRPLKIVDLNEKICNDYREYLLTAPSQRNKERLLSKNSIVSYFNKFKAALKQAYKDGLLTVDLNIRIKPIKQAETHREYLTLEELQKLVKTDCELPILKTAALFSVITGMRFSDIENLTWNQIQYSKAEGYYIQFRQQKTKGMEVLPISKQAYSLLGKKDEPTQKVFQGLKYSAYNNIFLKQWVMKAGINKKITFHCFRHTFAVLQLANDTDIYTVSKMMGHRDLKTTQVYARIVDKAKRKAADKIKLNL